uniref:Ion_trans domain-containing protein n=1 Tax=Gongylonema pulchrum TaxID=637853 RepID=A0A183EFW2_9BILA
LLSSVFSCNFWLDISSIFPFDFILIYRGDISLVRLNRLLKSYRFIYFIDRTEMRTNWPNAFRIFILIVTCIVLFHWNACAYFLISVISGIDGAPCQHEIWKPVLKCYKKKVETRFTCTLYENRMHSGASPTFGM